MTNKLEPGKDIKDNTDNTWHPTGLWHRHLCITYSESKVESKSSPSNMFKRVRPKKMGSLEKWFDPWNWLLLWLSPANHWFRKENDPHFSMMFRESICCFYRKGITPKKPPESLSHHESSLPSFNLWRFGQSSIPESALRKSQELALDKDLQKLRESHDVIISPRVVGPVNPSKFKSQELGIPWIAMARKQTRFMNFFEGTSQRLSGSSTRWRQCCFSSGLWSNHQMVRSNQWPNLYNDVGVSLVTGMIDAFYGRIASSFSWIFCSFVSPLETKGKHWKSGETKGKP